MPCAWLERRGWNHDHLQEDMFRGVKHDPGNLQVLDPIPGTLQGKAMGWSDSQVGRVFALQGESGLDPQHFMVL